MLRQDYLAQQQKIQQAFYQNKELPHVVLFDAFTENFMRELIKNVRHCKFMPEQNILTHSHTTAKLPATVLSPDFLSFIAKIIRRDASQAEWRTLCFTWRDYTILSDTSKEKPGFDVIIDVTEHWEQKAGGQLVYVDGKGNYTKLPVYWNTVIIVKRKRGIQRFVRYLNHYAKGKKRHFILGRINA